MNSSLIRADVQSIEDFFNEKCYVVPNYQRDYAWSMHQWEQLWSDLQSFKNENKDQELFLGSVIVVEEKMFNTSKAVEQYSVVDGQQRLTTIQIILSIIRDSWVERSKNESMSIERKDSFGSIDRASIERFIITNNLDSTGNRIPSFTANKQAKDVFIKFIQARDHDNFEDISKFNVTIVENFYRVKEIANAHNFFKNKIKELSIDELDSFENFLCKKVKILKITAGDSTNAYNLFETLNYRGTPLAQTDLVKNYIFSILNSSHSSEYEKKWDRVMESVGNKKSDQFFRHVLLMTNSKIQKKDIYETIRRSYQGVTGLEKFLNDIVKYSKIYEFINCEEKFIGVKSDVINEILEDLNDLKVETQNIFVMAVLSNLIENDNTDSRKIAVGILKLTEILSFRWTVCGGNGQDLENHYQVLSKRIFGLKLTNVIYEETLNYILKILPKDIELKEAMCSNLFKDNGRVHYILRKIDRHQKSDTSYELKNRVKLNIEHIAPRKPEGSYWEDSLKHKDYDYENLVHKIGNMILISGKINNSISNKSFDKKKIKYKEILNQEKNNNPELTREAIKNDIWNAKAILDMTEYIAQLTVSVWQIISLSNKQKNNKNNINTKNNIDLKIYDSKMNIIAEGVYVNEDKFILKAGSRIVCKPSKSEPKNVSLIRKKILKKANIAPDSVYICTSEDISLKSSSSAGSLVKGTSCNGPETWKTSMNVKLNNLLKNIQL